MDERVGFVILHYGDMTVTDKCVQSILRMEGWEQTLIVIVDNEVQRIILDIRTHGMRVVVLSSC